MGDNKSSSGWWSGLRLRTKLIAAFLFFAGIIALSGASGLFFVIEVGGTVEVLTNVSSPLSEETMRLTSRINKVRSVWETATSEEDAARLTAQAGLVQDLDGQTAAGIERLRGLASAGNISLDIDQAEMLRTQYIQQTTDLIANHGQELQAAASVGERRARFDSTYAEIQTLLTTLARSGEDEMNQREDATKTFVQSGRATVTALDAMLQDTFNQSYPVLRDTYTVMRYLTVAQAATQSYVGEDRVEQLAAIEKELAGSFRRTKSRLKRLQRRITDGAAREDLDKLTKGVEALKAALFDDNGLLAARRNLLDANMRASTMKVGIAKTGEDLEALLLTFTEATRVLNEGVKADTNKGVVRSQSVIGFIVVGGIFVGLVFGFFFARGITLPVNRLTDAMRALADGDNNVEIPATDGKDEIGDMARAVLVFKDNAIEKERMDAEQAEARAAKEEEANRMIRLCGEFDKTATDSLRAVSSAATEMQATAQQMSATAEETSRQSASVATSSEQATANVQTVAATAEELSASIAEIGRQVMQSAKIARNAVEEAESTNETVKGLANAASKIGEVVDLINDIAGQTNLLALNATIEAARAGEAGKGFAVVAQEVKNLANQTAKATEEISSQIGAVQDETNDAVGAIEKIRGIIGEVNDIATTISSAVEEQGVSTQEIARNVQQAAKGTQDVNNNIENVSKAAGETGTASGQVLNAAQDMSRQAEGLRGEVEKFLREIRAA